MITCLILWMPAGAGSEPGGPPGTPPGSPARPDGRLHPASSAVTTTAALASTTTALRQTRTRRIPICSRPGRTRTSDSPSRKLLTWCVVRHCPVAAGVDENHRSIVDLPPLGDCWAPMWVPLPGTAFPAPTLMDPTRGPTD